MLPIIRYFTTVVRDNNTASLFGMVISNDVESSTPMTPVEVRYTYTVNNLLVGLEVWNNATTVMPLAIFADGTVYYINPATGATTLFAKVFPDPMVLAATTAIAMNPANNLMYVLVKPAQGEGARQIVTLGLATGATSITTIQKLANFDAAHAIPFEMNYLPTLRVLMVFYTGLFDQLVYTDPSSGMTSFAVSSLMDYNIEFYFDDFLEDDDTWANSAYDAKHNYLYFQCTETSASDDETTISLCRVTITSTEKDYLIPQICISPMTYGYAGMQFVQVVQ